MAVAPIDQVRRELQERDYNDTHRAISPLTLAEEDGAQEIERAAEDISACLSAEGIEGSRIAYGTVVKEIFVPGRLVNIVMK